MSIPIVDQDPVDPRYTRRGAIYVPAGQGPTIWAVDDTYTIKLTASQTNGSLGFIDASVPPGGGPFPHMHPNEDETFYLLAGDLVHIPRGTRHRFRNLGKHTARMIFLFTPGGVEQAFLDHALEARDGEKPPPLDDDQAQRLERMLQVTGAVALPDLE
jgi:quercetin dioxygenase-like cupin family protein